MLSFLGLFKKKILIGNSDDTVVAIIDHLEKSNVPFEIGINDILKQSSGRFRSKENDEVYELFYTVEVQKEYVEQVEHIINQYMNLQDIKQDFKSAKKINRKLERKETIFSIFVGILFVITLQLIEIGKSEGANIVSYSACLLLLIYGMFITIKHSIELRRESESRVSKSIIKTFIYWGIGVMVYAVVSIISILR